MDFLRETLTRAAQEQGFVLVGFARLHTLSDREEFYRRWLADSGNASMTYLAKEPELRFDPRRLGARYTQNRLARRDARQNRGVRARPRLSRPGEEARPRRRQRHPAASPGFGH